MPSFSSGPLGVDYLLERAADMHRARLQALLCFPWNRAAERPIHFEDARTVFEMFKLPPRAGRESVARDVEKSSRRNIEENGARLFVDPKSYLYLHETTLDYQEDLMRRGFVFQNPQATRSCGCGSSFTA